MNMTPARALEDRGRDGSSSAGSRASAAGEDEAQHRDERLAAIAWVVRLSTPSVTAAMSAIPVDSPSRPSMKLMLLIIPTIQTTVKADRERCRRSAIVARARTGW